MRAWHWILIGAFVLAAGGVAMWAIPASGRKYAPLFASAESANRLPRNLLARMAQQESSFLPAIITGQRVSPAGAVGIMQIVPKWHPGVDPTDPAASIAYAGRFMRQLLDKYRGNVKYALAAYNWGPGNVDKWLARGGDFDRLPEETRNYVAQIADDLGVA